MDARDLAQFLRGERWPISTELALQSRMLSVLCRALGVDRVAYEHRLGPGERIDFFVADGIGIEAKIKCAKRAIYRQLERYAKHDAVKALILISGTAIGLPEAINGKPVYFVSLGRSVL